MSRSTVSFLKGDIVSYKYNGMKGEVIAVLENGNLEVEFPSQNRVGGVLTATLSLSEIELISGGSRSSLTPA